MDAPQKNSIDYYSRAIVFLHFDIFYANSRTSAFQLLTKIKVVLVLWDWQYLP
jgi:hypothetical protein